MQMKEVKITTNLIGKEETALIRAETVKIIKEVVASTMGPFGRNILVQDQMMMHYSTKDGYTAINRIVFKEDLPAVILNHIKKVSSKLNRTVGDGTSSAVFIACELAERLSKIPSIKSHTLKEIEDVFADLSKIVESTVFNSRITINEDNRELLESIAYTSSNGDEEIAALILEALDKVGRHGIISTRIGTNEDTEILYTSGYEHYRGLIYADFITNFENKSFEVSGSVRTFLSKRPLTREDIVPFSAILQHCVENDIALIIIAPIYDDHFMQFLLTNSKQNRNRLTICPIDVPVKSTDAQEKFLDLHSFIGGHYVDEDVSLQKFYTTCDGFDNVLGSVGSVKITENDTRFFGPNEKYKNIRLERLNNEIIPALSLAKEENSFMFEKDNEIGTLSKRLSNLSDSGNASIIVGGKTSEEKKTKEFLIVDAISAVKSALKHGVVLGNNVTIPSALYSAFNNIEIEDEFIERVITEIVESYYSAFLHVVINVRPGAEVRDIFDECRSKYQTFNVRTGKMEKLSDLRGDDLGKTLLVNSVEADIEIFKTAVSIAILLAFSDNFLSSKGFHSERMIEMLPPM